MLYVYTYIVYSTSPSSMNSKDFLSIFTNGRTNTNTNSNKTIKHRYIEDCILESYDHQARMVTLQDKQPTMPKRRPLARARRTRAQYLGPGATEKKNELVIAKELP